MGEFEEKLNALLSNPDALSQVMNLAQSLDLGGGSNGGPPSENGGVPPSPPSASGGPGLGNLGNLGDLAGLGNLLGQIDPKLIQRLLPLVGELSGGSGGDERTALLYALRPYLKQERQDKVERALQLARLFHLGKKFLSGWEG